MDKPIARDRFVSRKLYISQMMNKHWFEKLREEFPKKYQDIDDLTFKVKRDPGRKILRKRAKDLL